MKAISIAQKKAECSKQIACTKKEEISSRIEEEGFKSYCTHRVCSNTLLKPFGKTPVDFWMLFFMIAFENNWELWLS